MKPMPEWSAKLELGGRLWLGASVGDMDVPDAETVDCRPPL